jgi:hypothetical protein
MKVWIAPLMAAMLWACAFGAVAGDVEHKQGEFRFFVGDAPGFVQPREIAPRWDDKAPGANDAVWRTWLFDEQVDRRKGLHADYIDYAFEARSATNLGDAGRYDIEFNPEYQRLVFHEIAVRRDGKWLDRLLPGKISLARRESEFENDMWDGRVTALIVLDDVRVGDVVRIRYTITGSNPILAGQGYDAMRTAFGSPMLDGRMRVLFDPGTQVASRVQNGASPPVVTATADAVEAVVATRAAASITHEGDYPTWYRPWPSVQVGPARTWGDVVDWALPLYPAPDALSADLEARIAQWKRLPDPMARLRAALRAVQDEVRYFGVEMGSSTHRPAAPSVTWTRRFGDCKDKTYLMTAILARLGIESAPALVSTKLGLGMRDTVPTAAAFDHVIVRAMVDGKPVWMDPTINQQGGDPRDTDLSDYGMVLPVAAGTRALVAIEAPGKPGNGLVEAMRFVPQAGGDTVRFEVEGTYTGAAADGMRRWIATVRNDELQQRYAEYYRKRFGELDVLAAPVVVDDREKNALKITEAYLLKSPFGTEKSARYIDVYARALDGVTELPNTMARKGPLAIGLPAHYRQDVRFEIPAAWRATFAPESLALATDAFTYSHNVDIEGKAVTLRYDLDVKARELPVAQANAHVAEVRKMRDQLSARLRFAVPAEALGDKERDARLKALLRDAIDNEGS